MRISDWSSDVCSSDLAKLGASEAAIRTAEAEADRLRDLVADGVLAAPRSGRILFRLAEPGEVLAAGGRVATLLDLTDVYMTVFMPSEVAGRIAVGADARIVIDAASGTPVPGKVSFVSPRAQFTPKEVEPRSERDTMMFRSDERRVGKERVSTCRSRGPPHQ